MTPIKIDIKFALLLIACLSTNPQVSAAVDAPLVPLLVGQSQAAFRPSEDVQRDLARAKVAFNDYCLDQLPALGKSPRGILGNGFTAKSANRMTIFSTLDQGLVIGWRPTSPEDGGFCTVVVTGADAPTIAAAKQYLSGIIRSQFGESAKSMGRPLSEQFEPGWEIKHDGPGLMFVGFGKGVTDDRNWPLIAFSSGVRGWK